MIIKKYNDIDKAIQNFKTCLYWGVDIWYEEVCKTHREVNGSVGLYDKVINIICNSDLTQQQANVILDDYVSYLNSEVIEKCRRAGGHIVMGHASYVLKIMGEFTPTFNSEYSFLKKYAGKAIWP